MDVPLKKRKERGPQTVEPGKYHDNHRAHCRNSEHGSHQGHSEPGVLECRHHQQRDQRLAGTKNEENEKRPDGEGPAIQLMRMEVPTLMPMLVSVSAFIFMEVNVAVRPVA